MWNFIPMFGRIGGLPLLLVYKFQLNRQISALLAWKLIYKHNFSPQQCYIWNNGCILYKNMSIFLKFLWLILLWEKKFLVILQE